MLCGRNDQKQSKRKHTESNKGSGHLDSLVADTATRADYQLALGMEGKCDAKQRLGRGARMVESWWVESGEGELSVVSKVGERLTAESVVLGSKSPSKIWI